LRDFTRVEYYAWLRISNSENIVVFTGIEKLDLDEDRLAALLSHAIGHEGQVNVEGTRNIDAHVDVFRVHSYRRESPVAAPACIPGIGFSTALRLVPVAHVPRLLLLGSVGCVRYPMDL
jgi:hypothetical protein